MQKKGSRMQLSDLKHNHNFVSGKLQKFVDENSIRADFYLTEGVVGFQPSLSNSFPFPTICCTLPLYFQIERKHGIRSLVLP